MCLVLLAMQLLFKNREFVCLHVLIKQSRVSEFNMFEGVYVYVAFSKVFYFTGKLSCQC